MSAEVTAALHRSDVVATEALPHASGALKNKFRRNIRNYDDADLPLTPLKLKPELAATLRKSATDYVWLRDEYGITFKEIDYDNIDPDSAGQLKAFEVPEDVYDFDEEKLVQLIDGALRKTRPLHSKRGSKGPAARLGKLFARKSKS